MKQLEDKVAIVTGAGGGYGEGIAKLFAREGARLVIADIDGKAAQRVATDIGGAAVPIRTDVSKGTSVKQLVDSCVKAFGKVDIVVNNAGTIHDNSSMLDVDEATFDRIFAVNVKAIYHMARAVIPLMRERGGGVILNVGSTGGIRPRPGLTWYNASKGAVHVLSKSMAVELSADRIRVNTICPVMGVTGMFKAVMGTLPDTPENRARFIATIPLGRFCKPSDVGAAAVFLASDAASFITGVEFPVDGGRTV